MKAGNDIRSHTLWTTLLGVRQKLFAPFVFMIVLELLGGAGIYAVTQRATAHVNEIYDLGNIQQRVSEVANLAAEENLILMLGSRGALSEKEWVSSVENLRQRSEVAELAMKELGADYPDFARALQNFREHADSHRPIAATGSSVDALVLHDRMRLDPATRRLFHVWHATLDDLDAVLERRLAELTSLGTSLPFLPFMDEIVSGGEELAKTIRHIRGYERVKELALWAEIKYVDFLESGGTGELEDAKEHFRLLRMRLNGISRSLTDPEEKKMFMDLNAWADVFDELLSDENSSTMYPYLPVALYRNGMPMFSAVSRQGEAAMKASYRSADLIGSSVGGLLQVYSWLLVFFAGLALVIAMLLGGVIMKQIGRLHGGFLRLGSGDFGFRLTVDRTDEIGDLQRGFNHAAADLESRERNLAEARDRLEDLAFRLQHYNENLEREVQERTAELRAANEELMQADRMKSEFMANMSHELRTPLNSIIGFSKVLLNGIDGPVSKRQEQDLELIHQSGTHLLSLINEVLDLARIESGKLSLFPEALDPGAVAEQAMDTARTLSAGKPLELSVRVKGMPPHIRADRTRLTQMLLNLIGNAVKFTERGSVVLEVEADVRDAGPGVAFRVIDTGPGIRAEERDRIFDKFHQADSSSTRKHGGSGLGLAIAKEMAELHGGTITVESEMDQGSTFTIWLPAGGPPETGNR